MRIPKEFGAKEGEISINQEGNRWIIEPIESKTWPKNFFEQIRIEDPKFTRPEQGAHRAVDL